MLNSTDKPHITIIDGTNHHQALGKDIPISNEHVDFYVVNPSEKKILVEILKDGVSIYSDCMLNRTMKSYTDTVNSDANYIVNFYNESSKLDSEVIIEGITDNNYDKTPIERYSFCLTCSS